MKYLTLILLLCAVSRLGAQTDSASQAFINKKCRIVYCFLDDKTVLPRPALFSNMEVKDVRSDTTRIGIVRSFGADQQLRFQSSLPNTIAHYLNTHFAAASAPDSYLLVIRKLWSFDSLISAPARQETTQFYYEYKAMLAFRGEVFAKTNEGLLPVCYLDTVVDVSGSGSKKIFIQLPLLLSTLAHTIAGADIAGLKERKRTLTPDELNAHYRVRLDYPIQHAPILQKGVYADLQEFKNNQPSITNFETRKNNDGSLDLFIKDDKGGSYYSKEMWGYCDGTQCYIMMDGNLFPMLHCQDQFYILGSKEYKVQRVRAPFMAITSAFLVAGLATVKENVIRKMRLFRLNAETGDIQ